MSASNKIIQAAAGNTGEAESARNDATVLLLNGDGTSGAQNNTFTDSSSNNYTVTRTNNTTQGSFTPYNLPVGRWGTSFSGAVESKIRTTSVDTVGTDSFTAECWLYLNTAVTTYKVVFKQSSNENWDGWNIVFDSSGNIGSFGIGAAVQGIESLNVGQWYHLALTRDGTTVRFFIDGVLKGTVTSSANFTDTSLSIGNDYTSSYGIDGFVSNARLVIGSALYTADFDVPTEPLTAVTGTKLLTCNSYYPKDYSADAHFLDQRYAAKVAAFSPFARTSEYSVSTHGGSIYFDGTDDDLNVGSASNWTFLSNNSDYTIEGWFYCVYPGPMYLVSTHYTRSGTGTEWSFDGSDSVGLEIYVNNSGNGVSRGFSGLGWQRNAWNYVHIKAVRSTSTAQIFTVTNGITGQSSGYTTGVAYSSSSPGYALHVGQSSGGSGDSEGYVCDLRIKSVAETFSSLPTAPLTSDADTELLLSGQDAGIIDNAGKTALTNSGTVQIDTAEKKYGTGSIEFSANGNLITEKSDVQSLGGGDFTIEMWINHKSTGNMLILSQGGVGDTRSFAMQIYSGALYWQSPYGTVNIFNNTYTSMNDGNWHHLAVVRSGGTITMYFDGVAQTNTASNGTNYDRSDYPFSIANDGALNAYIDDLRITKGFARYTENFTPPTQALTAHDEEA